MAWEKHKKYGKSVYTNKYGSIVCRIYRDGAGYWTLICKNPRVKRTFASRGVGTKTLKAAKAKASGLAQSVRTAAARRRGRR